ncbi:hypothetical protein TNCV_4853341 [Trichonephila clavipes]|nr:hypothetical protein TNCV_4853341 [Trichonephila clavipes]
MMHFGCHIAGKIVVVVANATFLTVPDRGPRNSSWQWARGMPVCGLSLVHHTVTKLPVRLIRTTNEWRLAQGHETSLRVKWDIGVSSELDKEA